MKRLTSDIHRFLTERMAERLLKPGHLKNKIVAVPPIVHAWFPVLSRKNWYIDSRLIPNPESVVYWEGPGSDGHKWRREVIIVDTSVTELSALWEKYVFIFSQGPPEDAEYSGLPPRAMHMGRFDLSLDRATGMSHPEDRPCPIYFQRRGPVTNTVAFHTPRFTKAEMRILNSRATSEKDQLKKYATENGVKERVKREFLLPDGITIVGRVLLWFRPPAQDEVSVRKPSEAGGES